MYQDDHAATFARLEAVQRELSTAQSQTVQDQQRIAMLSQQLVSLQQALQRMGGQMNAMQGYGYGMYQLPSRGGTVLVLGILSLVVCSVLGPFAWSMGNEELRRIDSGITSPEARGSAQAGRICGIISSSLIGLFLLMFMFGLLLAH